MKHLTTNEIRKMWLDFWQEKDHYLLESKSLIPVNDDSLLFINSGIATLKKYLSGEEVPPHNRITNSQKSLRTNDIENVGVTARHHTMFEMLGNFSIGDYFKDEAIEWGWELLTDPKYFDFDIDKLYITVHPDDHASFDKWISLGVSEDKIVKTEDNFWEIGKGPGGPNTEIFYDRGIKYDSRDVRELLADDLENDRVIEIWNIVFSQYNCDPSIPRSEYQELPQQNIDTGMGLERMACVLQEVETNFETDNFKIIMESIENITNSKYIDNVKAYRVIADHVRSLTFAISDGVNPSNEGRGYVIRRILRRAAKYGYMDLKMGEQPFIYKLVDAVVKQMAEAYPELAKNQEMIETVIKREEESFLQTLKEGMKHFAEEIKDINGNVISGEQAFKLYDTYGFPIELTLEMAEERGLEVDVAQFNVELDKQKERARNSRKDISSISSQNDFFKNIDVESAFIGYDNLQSESKIVLITNGEEELDTLAKGEKGYIIFDKTPFYATSGGQETDLGKGQKLDVLQVSKLPNGQHLHEVIALEDVKVGDIDTIIVDEIRRNKTSQNHSATHLLNNALIEVFGDQITQAGSNQDDKRTRFDFTIFTDSTAEDINKVQSLVNEHIKADYDVTVNEMGIEDAKATGARAQFGEKYGDIVRVVKMGPSIELCGGTHVTKTGEIEKFLIINEQSVGSGIRRIEGIVGSEASDYLTDLIEAINSEINDLNGRIAERKEVKLDVLKQQFNKLKAYTDFVDANTLKEIENKLNVIEKESNAIKEEQAKLAQNNIGTLVEELLGKVNDFETTKLIEEEVNGISNKELKEVSDKVIERLGSGIVILKLIEGNKISIVVKVSEDITDKYNAGNIIKEKLAPYNGRGGGKPTMAQGGGTIA